MHKEWVCPRCKQVTIDFPALSRKDNKTEICSACGTEEALQDYVNSVIARRETKDKNLYNLMNDSY